MITLAIAVLAGGWVGAEETSAVWVTDMQAPLYFAVRVADVDRARGLFKVGFQVADVEAVAVRSEKATGERPKVVDFEPLAQRILQLKDPEGNVIQLFSPLEP